MDAQFNADFDVDVLSAAFNMDKADFMGRLFLIDDWTSFDNDRFEVIRANSDGIEEVTSSELALMAKVKAVIMDEEWFQVYDNLSRFAEKFIASGLRWNYFYHTWKTVSMSPYANAVVFVDSSATTTNPATYDFVVQTMDRSDAGLVIALVPNEDPALSNSNFQFVQTEDLTEAGVAVYPYGAFIIPASALTGASALDEMDVEATLGSDTYTASIQLIADDTGDTPVPAVAVGDTVTFTKSA